MVHAEITQATGRFSEKRPSSISHFRRPFMRSLNCDYASDDHFTGQVYSAARIAVVFCYIGSYWVVCYAFSSARNSAIVLL